MDGCRKSAISEGQKKNKWVHVVLCGFLWVAQDTAGSNKPRRSQRRAGTEEPASVVLLFSPPRRPGIEAYKRNKLTNNKPMFTGVFAFLEA